MNTVPSDPPGQTDGPAQPSPLDPAPPLLALPLDPARAGFTQGQPSGDLTPLDPRAISYWRVHSLIGSCLLLGALAVAGAIVAFNLPESIIPLLALWSGVLLFRLWWFFWHPVRTYRAWGFRVDDKVLETRQGIWWHVIILLPLSRLQHVDLHRGPLERYFGLTSLVLQTAGTQNATMIIPGLDAALAVRLRDHLIAVGGDDAV